MRTFIIGDVHGCRAELERLVRKMGYRSRAAGDHMVFVGDLIDRGPDPVGCVALAMELESTVVRGNHEDSALRWLAYEERVRTEPGFVNPMEHQQARKPKAPKVPAARTADKPRMTPEQIAAAKAAGAERSRQRKEAREAKGEPAEVPSQARKRVPERARPIPEERKAEWRALAPEHVSFLRQTACYVDLAPDWYVFHAGCEARPVIGQEAEYVMRVRYVFPETGRMAPYVRDTMQPVPGSIPWQEAWDQPCNIVYGHAVHSLRDPRIDVRGTYRCFGIDTGCVYGGRLTAMVIDGPIGTEPYFVQVAAERAYVPIPKGGAID